MLWKCPLTSPCLTSFFKSLPPFLSVEVPFDLPTHSLSSISPSHCNAVHIDSHQLQGFIWRLLVQ